MSAAKFEELKSCLPIDALIQNGKPQIEWLDLTGIDFREPFFNQTVERARTLRPEVKSVFSDLDALLQINNVTAGHQPTGFIFHTSRCGSTLVANACRALDASRVIAEPPVVDKLVSRLFTDAEPDSAKELLYLTLIRAAIQSFAPALSNPDAPILFEVCFGQYSSNQTDPKDLANGAFSCFVSTSAGSRGVEPAKPSAMDAC